MEENKFKCMTCKKYYKSYQSLWHHKKRYHENIPTNIPILSPNIPILPTNIPILSPEIDSNTNSDLYIKKTENKTCDYCNKILSSYKNLHRHLKICKLKEKEEEQEKEEKEEMKNEIVELKKMVEELIKNKGKSKTINNTNSHNTNTNTNNGTINNNYITIVPFGKENFVEVTTEKEHLFILKQEGNNVLYKCIEMKHFNEDLPQFHNFIKLNNRTNEAKIYDETVKDFKVVKSNEIIDDVITNAEYDIDDMFNLHQNKINEKQKENVRRVVDKPYSEQTEKHVNKMAYDYRKRVYNTHKKNNTHKSVE